MRLIIFGPTDILSSPGQTTGGIVSHTRFLIENLKDEVKLTVITFDDVSDTKTMRFKGVCYIILPRISGLFSIVALLRAAIIIRKITARIKYDRVIIQAISYYLFIFPRIKIEDIYIFMHGIMFREYSPLLNNQTFNIRAWARWLVISTLEFLSWRLFKKFILINEEMGKFFKNKKSYLLRNQPKKCEISVQNLEKEKLIICVGNIIPRKRQHLLINEFIKCNLQDWKLILVGRASSKYAESLSETVSLYNNILIMSSVNDEELKNLFSSAQVFCLPSSSESSPISILEALQFGCKVIASDVGGISEIRRLSKEPVHFHLFSKSLDLGHNIRLVTSEKIEPINHDLEFTSYSSELRKIIND